jgi:hypothetical protein
VTLIDDDEVDPIAELERMDRFFDGDEPGEVPLEILRENGIVIPEEPPGDETVLRARLWEIVEGMADIGMVVENTDHLSDLELYRFLVEDALLQQTILPMGPGGTWHLSPIGSGSEEDNEIYLRYYADDEYREMWRRDTGAVLPPREKPPCDRDRFLPGHAPLVS